MNAKKDISVIIPTVNEAENIGSLIDKTKKILEALKVDYEIIIVDGGSIDNTIKEAIEHGASMLRQKMKGYGSAIREGISASCGNFILTMDADLSHGPEYIKDMWVKRDKADMIVASRYVKDGRAEMPWPRLILSIVLNKVFTTALSLPLKDISSGFRMYKADVLTTIELKSCNFDILQEILIKLFLEAYEILEIPFCYRPRKSGKSHVKLLRFGFSYIKTLFSMWLLRNSIFSADYDSRAYNSKIPIQRYWQRKRFTIIKNFIGGADKNILDIGCGSSRIIKSLPNAVGLDIRLKVLRHLNKTNTKLVQGALENLCFKKDSFDLIIISEVIEHIPKEHLDLNQIKDILRKDTFLIIGTPDYGRIFWPIIEYFYAKLLPHAYSKGHISHYTFNEVMVKLRQSNFIIEDYKYICGSELIIKAKKAERL